MEEYMWIETSQIPFNLQAWGLFWQKSHEERGPLFLVITVSWCIAEEQDYLSLKKFSLDFCGDNKVISF